MDMIMVGIVIGAIIFAAGLMYLNRDDSDEAAFKSSHMSNAGQQGFDNYAVPTTNLARSKSSRPKMLKKTIKNDYSTFYDPESQDAFNPTVGAINDGYGNRVDWKDYIATQAIGADVVKNHQGFVQDVLANNRGLRRPTMVDSHESFEPTAWTGLRRPERIPLNEPGSLVDSGNEKFGIGKLGERPTGGDAAYGGRAVRQTMRRGRPLERPQLKHEAMRRGRPLERPQLKHEAMKGGCKYASS
jgi:hypothetical protein